MALEQESPFDISELFVSITDKKGIIKSGNDTFVRVSEWPREKLIGSPHNIIRHQDMPKCVFKLLWDNIQKGIPLIAYVKNRSAKGKYYWVMASVIPIDDGYISIRIKPSSPLLRIVESVYSQALKIEQESGMSEGLKFIVGQIEGLGFKNYYEFMIHVAREELSSRSLALSKLQVQKVKNNCSAVIHDLANELTAMHEICRARTSEFEHIFNEIESVRNFPEEARKRLESIRELTSGFASLATNMSISSHRLGNHGQTLMVVARAFKSSSEEMKKVISEIETILPTTYELVSDCTLQLVFIRLQLQMITYFSKEVMEVSCSYPEREVPYLKFYQSDLTSIIKQVEVFFKRSLERIEKSLISIITLKEKLPRLEMLQKGLDMVRLGGALEGQSVASNVELFGPYILEMKKCVFSTDIPIKEISELVNNAANSLQLAQSALLSSLTEILKLELINMRVSVITPHEESNAIKERAS